MNQHEQWHTNENLYDYIHRRVKNQPRCHLTKPKIELQDIKGFFSKKPLEEYSQS